MLMLWDSQTQTTSECKISSQRSRVLTLAERASCEWYAMLHFGRFCDMFFVRLTWGETAMMCQNQGKLPCQSSQVEVNQS